MQQLLTRKETLGRLLNDNIASTQLSPEDVLNAH